MFSKKGSKVTKGRIVWLVSDVVSFAIFCSNLAMNQLDQLKQLITVAAALAHVA